MLGAMKPWLMAWLGMGALLLQAAGAEVPWVRREWADTGALLANPGQGWMSTWRQPPKGSGWPVSVVYLRFEWAQLEPEEGHYNWAFIDDVLTAWQARGVTLGLRVMTTNPHSEGYYSSPAWLFQAGCRGTEYRVGGGDPTSGGKAIARIEPDYADPIYLAKHGAFLAALGRRYEGLGKLEFVDIGSYGLWGEWHTDHPAPAAVRRQIVDLYRRAFPKTPLMFMTDDAEILAYALPSGVGLRRDGVGSPWHEKNWIGSARYAGVPGMAEAWRAQPVVFEWFGDYAYFQSKGWSFPAAVDFMLRNHVTLLNDNLGRVSPAEQPLVDRLARLAGARFVPREVAHPASMKAGTVLPVKMQWVNAGVGRLYHPYELRLALWDAQGKAVSRTEAVADAQTWFPGEWEVTGNLPVPKGLAAGEYSLALGLFDPTGRRRAFALPITAAEREGWYTLGPVQVVEQ